ncbi:FAD-dependent oxidoreductase [Nocardia terpenica]|uniref:FAD-dependent oxidoreductase n=1 Tax=Nocardia terpenica TaxID=455432 RepID=UPI000A6EF61C|nr:FAD-dependent oxidoreductase [Nocardia terpenica]MBF6065009.1 FAD-dependent oxidoreductase [Nocardia terpenica]MBF6108066.1 FAD-dependent oxidoreductase [Nocardia terpenica]MBF6115281.1 FAD-dependent oxidoreductase [Nocardia terpenica]MBF6122603.1 FAD-dependent oxidoreductase [Nocardia terpenica]NQE88626.1 NAD(P)-binding protein [Nocardia terpenica]
MERERGNDGLSRRTLLAAGAIGLASAAGTSLAPRARADLSTQRRRGGPPRNRVAVLGAGIGGLTAAHELAERGFEVTVFDRKELGGKSRTIGVPGSAAGGRAPLPGEHGARGFTSFYHHVHDTMRRIPVPGNANGVYDNLVPFSVGDPRYPRANNLPDGFPLMFGFYFDPKELLTPQGWQRVLVEMFLKNHAVPVPEALYLASRFVAYLTSSEERRFGQWEHTSWWDFVGAASRSAEYRGLAATGLTRALVAAKETVASARSMGNMAEAFLLALSREATGGPKVYEVLNGPTDEVWLDHWITLLRNLGVQFHTGHEARGFTVDGGSVSGARIRRPDGSVRDVDADWYVCAVPTDRARGLWSDEMRRLDPALAAMDGLFVDWMNGLQLFVTQRLDLGHGYNIYLDAPWRLTSYTQKAFWPGDYASKYGDGSIVDGLTIDIADWDTPGLLFGKPAKMCTRDEIYREVWAQLTAALDDDGRVALPDGIVRRWQLDPGITWADGQNHNDEPLLVNTVGSWAKRPTARTAISNLFLAADYVQTDFDLATMEGANEAARRAVNAILDASGSSAPRAQLFSREGIAALEPLRQADAARYRAGQPNLFDLG